MKMRYWYAAFTVNMGSVSANVGSMMKMENFNPIEANRKVSETFQKNHPEISLNVTLTFFAEISEGVYLKEHPKLGDEHLTLQ